MQTFPISGDGDFGDLDSHIDAALGKKGFKRLPRKGSTSWIDPEVRPLDSAVRFKLCDYANGKWFGGRESWAKELGIPLETIGSMSETVNPSAVLFRGEYVANNTTGRRCIDRIIGLFPDAGGEPIG